ncbi:hypothetical protein Tco_1475293 [Tanacetum coccineum]
MTLKEVKEEFDKLIKQIDSFAPISFEATKDSLKRFGEELQTKTPKRLKEDKDDEAKDDEPTRIDEARRDKHRDDLIELYRIVMNRYGLDGPEDKLEKGFWKCLRIMFEEPLSTDSIWSEIEQQKIKISTFLLSSNKGDAPAKPPQIITTNTLSNIKLPVLQKDDYDNTFSWHGEAKEISSYQDIGNFGEKGNDSHKLLMMLDLIHEDLDQIDGLDLERDGYKFADCNDCIEIKKVLQEKQHFARECKFKGSKDGSRQEASRGQDFKPVRTEKEALMTIDEGQINWVEQTTDEELNHALMLSL